jgi:hypothetical protein
MTIFIPLSPKRRSLSGWLTRGWVKMAAQYRRVTLCKQKPFEVKEKIKDK